MFYLTLLIFLTRLANPHRCGFAAFFFMCVRSDRNCKRGTVSCLIYIPCGKAVRISCTTEFELCFLINPTATKRAKPEQSYCAYSRRQLNNRQTHPQTVLKNSARMEAQKQFLTKCKSVAVWFNMTFSQKNQPPNAARYCAPAMASQLLGPFGL